MKYRHIDHLLINTNKGSGIPPITPGDSVMVSLVGQNLLPVLIHQVDSRHHFCTGVADRTISDKNHNDIVCKDEPIMFAFSKIAGINRAR